MRYIVDTHIFIWYAKERDNLSRNVLALFDDYNNEFCISSESLKELIVLWNKKPSIRCWWKTPLELIRAVEDYYNFTILYLHKEHYETYARLQINEAQEHYDPSDHLIISHAICNGIPLISSDSKFPFYRNQGLELIEND
ncbi:MAG: type II toxin-antitoxin system VapC family toxin [Bacteroidales bacterium]|nr:type II toxin-antitoxin system VapC family toxin [Bacteroidales bacterium]